VLTSISYALTSGHQNGATALNMRQGRAAVELRSKVEHLLELVPNLLLSPTHLMKPRQTMDALILGRQAAPQRTWDGQNL
jgi:hypothetical protein